MNRDGRMLVLADLAGTQWGLFTAAQAGEFGLSAQQLKRLADADLISRLRHGVYRLVGVPQTPQDPIRAEWLALEPERLARDRLADETPIGVVSHRSAALLQDLGDVDADVHEFTVPRRRGTRSSDVKFHIRELAQQDWHLVAGLPVTRPLRTVVDLARARTDGGHLATIVRDAILTNDTTRDELADALRPYAHYYGLALGAGDDLVRSFISQAGVPESAIALTRPADEAGLPGVALIEGQELTNLVLSLHRRSPAELRAMQRLLDSLADDQSRGIGFAEQPVGPVGSSRSAGSGFDRGDEDRGGDDGGSEKVSDRSGFSAGDQRSDRETGAQAQPPD